MSHLTFPNETTEYRKARSDLLAEEIALRRHIEEVAAQRRALPSGGDVPQDYVFERIGDNGMPEQIEMSKLFGRHATLILYSFMYGPDREAPCPMCTQILDSVNGGKVRHFWGSELSWAPSEPGQNHRSGDAVSALWGLLDMTPEGRRQFLAKLVY